jgi:hypothetical protein
MWMAEPSVGDWETLRADLSSIDERDHRPETRLALSIVVQVCDLLSSKTDLEWLTWGQVLLAPAYRHLRSSVSTITNMPSEAAYAGLKTATLTTVTVVPTLRELDFTGSHASASSLMNATTALQGQIAAASSAVEADAARFAQIISLSTDDALARSYAAYAAAESKRADRWRIAAVSVFAIAVALAAAVVLHSLGGSPEPQDLAARASLSAALAVLGAYLQHQSALHRGREGDARTLEMRLRTLGPFSAALPADDAAKMRSVVGLAIFAADGPAMGGNAAQPTVTMPPEQKGKAPDAA